MIKSDDQHWKNAMCSLYLSTEELIAKEAYYHSSCYSTYTIILYHYDRGNAKNSQSIPEIAFAAMKTHLTNLYKNTNVVEFTRFTKEVEAKLSTEEYDPKEIDSEKRNLRRTIENHAEHFHFVNTSRILLIYPDSLETHELVESLYKVKQELSTLKASPKDEKTVFYAAKIIRNEIKGLTDKMNWPPSYAGLTAEKLDIGIIYQPSLTLYSMVN